MVGWIAVRSRANVALALVPLCPASTQKLLDDSSTFNDVMKMVARQ
jgi:hypothetical protein